MAETSAAPTAAMIDEARDAATAVVLNCHNIVGRALSGSGIRGDTLRAMLADLEIDANTVSGALEGPLGSWAVDLHLEPVRGCGFTGESWLHLALAMGQSMLRNLRKHECLATGGSFEIDFGESSPPDFSGVEAIRRGLLAEGRRVKRLSGAGVRVGRDGPLAPSAEPSWDIRDDGQVTFGGTVIETTGIPRAILVHLVRLIGIGDGRCSREALRVASGDQLMSDGALKENIRVLRGAVRRSLGFGGNPIPSAGRGADLRYWLDVAPVRNS